MNKKTLFLVLLGVVLIFPTVAFGTTLTEMLENLKTVLIAIGASVVVIGWVIAGVLYLTVAGAPEKINVAKGALKACVIGTILVILADASATIIEVVGSAFGL